MLKQKNIKLIIFSIIIIIQPIIAQITAIMTRNGNSVFTVGMVFNGIILLFGLIYILFFSKSKYKKKSLIYLSLIFIFFLLFYILKHKTINLNYLFRESVFMFKYWYFPVTTLFLINLLDTEKFEIKHIENSVKINMIIYCLLIIIAEIIGTSYLSYQNSYYGKMGWFYSANELGTLLVILLPYMFLNTEKKKINYLFIIISIITVLFIGTKTSFLGTILLVIMVLINLFIKIDIKKKIALLTTTIIIAGSIFLINPPALRNMKQSLNYYLGFSKTENSETLPENATLSFLIFSERTLFFEKQYDTYIKSSLSTKLFGMGFANNDSNTNFQNHLVEMDFIDILFKYGIIGFIIYIIPNIYIIINLISMYIKNKIKLCFSDTIYMYIVTLAIMISSFAGHVLGSPSVSLFLAITFALLFYQTIRRLD